MNEYMTNQKAFIIKKWMQQLVGDNVGKHTNIIERISSVVTTQQDLEELSKLMGEVYEAGFYKAIRDYKKELKKHNINIKISTEKVDAVHS